MNKRLYRNRCFLIVQKLLSVVLIFSFVFGDMGSFLDFLKTKKAEAVQVTIDDAAFATPTSHIQSGSNSVFIDDQTGYKFFRDAPGYCVYRKTTDGGSTWSATTTVDSQTDCHQITVWYDKWTPGDTGTYIHISTIDAGNDDIWYNRLDTSNDNLLLGFNPVSMLTGSGQGAATLTEGVNFTSITKATNGIIYAISHDGDGASFDSFILECSASCHLAASWTETTFILDVANDQNILVPLTGGDIMLVQRDISADSIRSRVWDDGTGTWDGAWTTIDATAPENVTYDVGFAVAVSLANPGDVYLAYISRNTALGLDDIIESALYTGGAWSAKTNLVSFTEYGISNIALALNTTNDDVYVAYSQLTTPLTPATANVFWRKSEDGMTTWTPQYGPINTSADDIYGVNLNIASDERIFASWFDNTDDDFYGETIADITPGLNVTATDLAFPSNYTSYSQVTVDATVQTAGDSHLQSGSQTVFTTDQTGYKFYRDVSGECVYSKTTDGGTSWGAAVLVDNQGAGVDCMGISVWYDQWTPGSSGAFIHIATWDDTTDDVFYNNIDTANSDSRLTGATAVAASAQGNTNATGTNVVSITKGTDGTLYIAQDDTSDSFVVECSASCNLGGSWAETAGTRPQDLANDYSILVPLTLGDIMIINRDISANLIRYKIWNNTAWSGTWTTIDATSPGNATYDVGMVATVSLNNPGDVYLTYISRNATPGADDIIETALYTSGAWVAKTSPVTLTVTGLTNIAVQLDSANDDVYIAYSKQATANSALTANVFWMRSQDGMVTWSPEYGPVNTSADDVYGVNLGLVSDDRVYVTWFDNTDNDIYGASIMDLSAADAATIGEQITSVNANSSNVHIGGTFVMYTNHSTQTFSINSITVAENGTVDASTDISNVDLFYEFDTSAPYNCASESYSGSELPFGSTDTNGFSGPNGVSSFTGTTVTVDDTKTLCTYVVLDVLSTADSNSAIEISINDPENDVKVVSGDVIPTSQVDIPGSTVVYNDGLTQTHYHWRNDNGTQATATSKTSGIQDVSFNGYQRTPARLRMQVSNEGGTTSVSAQYRLEYAVSTTSCAASSGWTNVGASDDDVNMYPSTHLIEGGNTTNIAVAQGGVTDENIGFKTTNGAVRDTSSQTGSITATSTQFVEFEYSIIASTTAQDGSTYCFRLTDAGTPLKTYSTYPSFTISTDVNITASGTQTTTLNTATTNQYLGGKFVFTGGSGARTITSVMLTENGTVNAQTGLDNIRLKYDLDTTAPYDCSSESYVGSELQYGATSTASFSGANGTTTFSDSILASSTQAVCMYPVLDITSLANNGETVEIEISNASTDVTLTSGVTSPSIPRALGGTTTLVGAVLTQSRYHWRNDNGTQATATSKTAGVENTQITYIAQNSPVRLRIEVSNEGTLTSPNTALRLEYGTKITTCAAVGTWTDVGAALGAFDMYGSIHMIEGGDTTDVANALGGVTNDNTSFKSPNSAVKDTSSQIATTTFTSTEYLEAEFSIKQTTNAAYDETYCFRLSNAGTQINAYSVYPELTTSPQRDFEIQRRTSTFSGTSLTLVAGTDYTVPSASTSAFVRITNSSYTGAGDAAAGGNSNADDVTAYISNPSNIMTSFTIARPATAAATTTRVSWEIVEYIGDSGGDNEIKVRQQGRLTYGATSLTATATAATGIVDDADVVVFITGQSNPDTGVLDYNTGLSTSNWLSSSDQATIRRAEAGSDAVQTSFAVVEFTGVNWKIQREEHTYAVAGITETEAITALNSLTRTFVHAQKRVGTNLQGEDEFGHEVWISSIGAVSFYIEPGATSPTLQTSVAWIVENTQTSPGSMVTTRTNGFHVNGAEPLSLSVSIGKTLEDITNASLFASTRGAGTGTLFPRPIAGMTIASTTHYQIWRSDTGGQLSYRTEVVEWPTAGLTFTQNDYWFFIDNNLLLPDDPWPLGLPNLGESTVLTGADEPLGDGEHIRIRMSLTTANATMPADSKSFKLQYGKRVTSCGAISEDKWVDVGDIGSSAIWRGYEAPGLADGTTLSGGLLLTFSDDAGTYEEENNSAINPFAIQEGDTVEYDWHIEQNGAVSETFYCFRMVESNGTEFGTYTDWPQLRTSSFTAKSQNWRWYDDVNNETPTSAMALENTAPIDIANGSTTKLRVTIKETENIARDDVRFKLQYSEYSDFSTAYDVVSTSSCIASSTWCYSNGGGTDNVKITTKVLSDADSCAASVGDGCGTHNESPSVQTGFRHENAAASEYEFTLQAKALRANAVYYFRLYDLAQDIPVPTNTSESYPSLVAVGASLVFALGGLPSGTSTEGVVLDVTTTPTSIPFGTLSLNTDYEAGYRLNINTNATEGYKMLMYADQQLLNSYGGDIDPIPATNAVPASWTDITNGCIASVSGCFAYHAGDDSLEGGSNRFAINDRYAQLSTTTPQEIMYSSIPANDTHDIVYKLRVREKQEAGDYQATIIYIAVPVF